MFAGVLNVLVAVLVILKATWRLACDGSPLGRTVCLSEGVEDTVVEI